MNSKNIFYLDDERGYTREIYLHITEDMDKRLVLSELLDYYDICSLDIGLKLQDLDVKHTYLIVPYTSIELHDFYEYCEGEPKKIFRSLKFLDVTQLWNSREVQE